MIRDSRSDEPGAAAQRITGVPVAQRAKVFAETVFRLSMTLAVLIGVLVGEAKDRRAAQQNRTNSAVDDNHD